MKVFHGHISRQRMFTYTVGDKERSNLHHVDSMGVRDRKRGLKTRVNNVQGPNHLWRIDTINS